MTRYEKGKQAAREAAQEYQTNFSAKSWTWSEPVETINYFERVGRRFGLLKEFKEEGII